MKKNKLFILVIFIFIFVFLSSCDNTTNSDVTSNVNNQYTTNNNINDTFYTITFENYDGSILETVKVKKREVPYYSKGTPIRDEDDSYSYVFTGWYPSITAATKDQSYVAQYKKNDLPTFTVTFDANGGDYDGESTITYNVKKNNKIASPTSPTKKNYNFAGWTTSKNSSTLWNFSSDIVNKNITLYAKWEEKEAVILSVDNSAITDDQIYMVVDKDIEYVSLSNKIITSKNSLWKLYRDRLGQTEIPTKIGGTLVNGDNTFYIVVTNANGIQSNTYELVIHRSHLVSIKFIDDDYTILKNVYVDSGYEYVIDYIPTLEGYIFESWLLNGHKVTSFIAKDYTELEILKTPKKYKVTLDNQTQNINILGIQGSNVFDCGSFIELTAENIPLGYTIKWESSDNKVYYSDKYSFKVPAYDISVSISLISYYGKDNNKVYFGTYPQTKVEDNRLINELNIMAGHLPTSYNKYNWIDYNYFIEGNNTSYMYYQDIDYDANGTSDFRGVYFNQYRPEYINWSSSSKYSYQDDNGYQCMEIYWFSYDPIEWDILEETDGKALIISNLILDSQNFSTTNNYKLSTIRKFINETFYNTAFNDLQKAIIQTTIVDNSEESTGESSNKYICNDTQDMLFLLSNKEAKTFYNSNSARNAEGTDYAKSQGLLIYDSEVYCSWLLRSPSSFSYDLIHCISYDSIIGGGVSETYNGVRPACWINL